MKLSKLTSLMKKKKLVTLMQDGVRHEQWVRIGDAIYSLNKLPWLEDVETLLTILDMSDKEQDKLITDCKEPPRGLSLADADRDDRIMPDSAITIKAGDMELIPARTSVGLRFFEAAYLTPLSDMEGLLFFERMGNGGYPYIAVTYGFILVAVIVPRSYSESGLPEELQTLHSEMMETLSYEAAQEEEHEPED